MLYSLHHPSMRTQIIITEAREFACFFLLVLSFRFYILLVAFCGCRTFPSHSMPSSHIRSATMIQWWTIKPNQIQNQINVRVLQHTRTHTPCVQLQSLKYFQHSNRRYIMPKWYFTYSEQTKNEKSKCKTKNNAKREKCINTIARHTHTHHAAAAVHIFYSISSSNGQKINFLTLISIHSLASPWISCTHKKEKNGYP